MANRRPVGDGRRPAALALGLRLLKIRAIPVANLLPALLLAPLAVAAVGAFVH